MKSLYPLVFLVLLFVAACSSSNVGVAGPSTTPLPPPAMPGMTDDFEAEAARVAGAWNYQMTNTPVGTVSGVITLERAGEGFGGTMTEDYTNQTIQLEDIQVEGDKAIVANAPVYSEHLNQASKDFFSRVLEGLEAIGA